MRALALSVLRSNRLGDCTNDGITSRYDEILIEHPRGFIEIDETNPPENFCKMVKRDLFGRTVYSIEPARKPDEGCTGWMAGGNFAYSSDSRFSDLIGNGYFAVSVHDRQETWAQYDLLTR